MRRLAILLLFIPVLLPCIAADDDAPPIVIRSPDEASTFAFGSVKDHTLSWDAKNQMLIARIIFVDVDQDGGPANDDAHEFRLPGVSFDAVKGVFYATSPTGEVIPVAKIRRELFLKVVETLPNAVVRIQHPRGRVNVVLEALRPNDPALHVSPPPTNADGSRSIDLRDILH